MITLANQETIDTMSRLLREDFDKIDFNQDYIYHKAQECIDSARGCGLDALALEMETDKFTELC